MMTSQWVFDLKDDDTYWCTADVGWVTGHSYIVYGPLANGATVVMYEGAPNWPDEGRFWQLIEKYQVNILYTAPTAIRAFIKWGDHWPEKYDLSSLRLLGSVGEPINPEAWMWYHRVIGQERCPIVDTWWQTETGAIMISPLPGVTATKPGSCTKPLPGVVPDIVTKSGVSLPANQGGFLVMRQPWPSMLRTLYGDHDRFLKTYFSEIKGCYFAGDGARHDEEGYYWVMGRVDDVLNVAGHRLSTMEIESALVSHHKVAEAAVVGYPHDLKGEGICCFVTLKNGGRRRRAEGRAHGPRPQANRGRRHSRRDPLHERASQNAQRQDHAAAPPRHRRRPRTGRRHNDAGRLRHPRQASARGGVKKDHGTSSRWPHGIGIDGAGRCSRWRLSCGRDWKYSTKRQSCLTASL